MAKILLVEDDNNLREIYQARMEAEGYTVVTASDGEAALAVAAKEKPDLIVSDVMMPKISGFEMLDILRNTEGLKHTKVIMLTALGQAEDKSRADNLGANKYLVKSQVTLEDIVNAAGELLSDTPGGAAPAAQPTAAAPAPEPTPQPQPVAPATPAPEGTPQTQPAPVVPQPAPGPAQPTAVPEPVPTPQPTPTIPVATPPAAPEPQAPPATPTPEPPAATPMASPEPPTTPPAAVPAPTVAQPTDDATTSAVPEPAAAPAPEPTPQPQPVAPATPAPASEPTQAPPIPEPQAPPATPPTSTPPAAPVSAAAIDDKVVSNAVEQLLANSSAGQSSDMPPAKAASIQPPAATPADHASAQAEPNEQQSTSGNDSSKVAHKKVIRPISKPEEAPSLDALLAKENAANPPAPTPNIDGKAAQAPEFTQPQPGASFQPQADNIGKPASSDKGFDPNSISL